MQRWQGAALAVVLLCEGCLDHLTEDDPGYSRYVLPPGSPIAAATDDVTTFRKIDVNDGVTMPAAMPKTGWAAGEAVSYWDFGAGKRGIAPAYGLMNCGSEPTLVNHPVIVDSIPGDSDYSPFRGLQWACVTDKYKGEIIPSLDAFNDAIDLGLITDPTSTPAAFWINLPIVTPTVALGGVPDGAPRIAYYRNTSVSYHSLEPQEGPFQNKPGMGVQTGNVYELVKRGQTTASRVIFSQPFYTPGTSTRNPLYSPAWLVVTVTLKQPTGTPPGDTAALNAAYDAVLATLTKESDLVTVGMNNALTVVNTAVIDSAVATTNRVNRPFVVHPGGM